MAKRAQTESSSSADVSEGETDPGTGDEADIESERSSSSLQSLTGNVVSDVTGCSESVVHVSTPDVESKQSSSLQSVTRKPEVVSCVSECCRRVVEVSIPYQPCDEATIATTRQKVGQKFCSLNPRWCKDFKWIHLCVPRKKVLPQINYDRRT